VIVDEEHDASFKQDDGLAYHGRDLAVVRARHHGSTIILGSATPSITSVSNASSGKYRLLRMTKRVGNSILPAVTVIDLNKKQGGGAKGIIHKELLEKLQKNLSAGKQAILLLNRRGFSSALLCRKCGTPVQCCHCNVSLTLHKQKNRLICHYCGFTQTKDTLCLQCRSNDLVPAGFGTERVEEELLTLLPEARVSRLDSDTASDRKRFMNVLSQMHQREIDILVGTQMIAKGHHFPHVTLVAVVWADGGLSLPDYKAAERSFQLITQVTGRAGRGGFPGEVVIQTLRPEHYVIDFARKHQFQEFFNHEMRLRKKPAFPPYVRLVLLRISGPVERQVRDRSVALAGFCRRYVRKKKVALEILGPAPSPLDRVKDKYRYQLLIKGSVVSRLQELCTALLRQKKELIGNQCRLFIDVDPENMM
jgi:primosomal protein N' (replication factor Y)